MTFPPPLRALRAAFVFLTRIPVGGFPYSPDDFRWASAHFPFVGLVIGALGSGVLWFARPLGPELASLVALSLTVYLTGAFHEDGLADTLDALGGAHSKKKVLEILKDSRIGTYGGAGLVLSLVARLLALAELTKVTLSTPYGAVPSSIVVLPLTHVLARVGPVYLMRFLPYASEEGAKGSSVARGGETPQLCVASLWGLGASGLAVHLGLPPILLGAAGLLLAALLIHLARRFVRAVGGFTGDFLGASEQLGEILVLLLAVSVIAKGGGIAP